MLRVCDSIQPTLALPSTIFDHALQQQAEYGGGHRHLHSTPVDAHMPGQQCCRPDPSVALRALDADGSVPSIPHRLGSRFGRFMSGVEEFDAAAFRISPSEASVLDPQQRLMLQA